MSDSDFLNSPIAVSAWVGLINWAVRRPQIVAAFEAETGKRLSISPTVAALDAAIDRACGVGPDDSALDHFVVWVSDRFWGGEAPPAVAKKLEELRSKG